MGKLIQIIKEYERGLLFVNGGYQKVLKPGRYLAPDHGNRQLVILDVRKPFKVPGYSLKAFAGDAELAKELERVDVGPDELVLRTQDGHFAEILSEGQYAFWQVVEKHGFQRIDRTNPEVDLDLSRQLLMRENVRQYVSAYDVEPHEKGVLFYDNALQKVLEPGRYYFWTGRTLIKVVKVDMRARQLEITGQEILTEDKVPLRINFYSQYRITDVMKPALEIRDFEQQLYVLLQMVLREYIGSLKLDDILRMKKEIGDFVMENIRAQEADFGVQFLGAGVKDIILPGEIRDIMNTVLIAEKKALANVITRREETASTRSLLNTAKLMDENQTLYRLKELEYIERISDRIGNISLGGGNGLLEQLNTLLGAPVR